MEVRQSDFDNFHVQKRAQYRLLVKGMPISERTLPHYLLCAMGSLGNIG